MLNAYRPVCDITQAWSLRLATVMRRTTRRNASFSYEISLSVLRCLIADARSFRCPEVASLKIKSVETSAVMHLPRTEC